MKNLINCGTGAALFLMLGVAVSGSCSSNNTQTCDGVSSYYPDADGDGYGAMSGVREECAPIAGYVAASGDCDDSRSDVYPGANPLENVDANCDGKVDLDIDGDGVSDRTPVGFSFDPSIQKHIELDAVDASVPFTVQVHDGEVAPQGISLVAGSPFSKILTWNAGSRTLSGTISAPGVYRFPLSVCTVYPYDAAQCALPANRRQDLVHLTVRGAAVKTADWPAARGPFATGAKTVSLDVTGALSAEDLAILPTLVASDRPERKAETAALGTVSPMRVMFPADKAGEPASGHFPLLIILHGNGYHWDDYDTWGELLASQGIVVVVPQFPTGLINTGTLSSIERMEFGERAMKWALTESTRPNGLFAGRLDPTKVALAGHSWGGTAAEWAAPVLGARVIASIDPVGLLKNIYAWRTCNEARRTGIGTRDHLRSTWRDVSTPFLALDSGRSGFRTTIAAYSGLFAYSSFVHVSTEGTYHEDVLDTDEVMRQLSAGTCYSTPRVGAHQVETSRWLTAMVRRYVDDDLSYEALVHGAAGLTGPTTLVATRRGEFTAKVLDRGALHAFGEALTTPKPNGASGTSVIQGAGAVVDLAPAARELIPVGMGGTLDTFAQEALNYFSANSQYWKLTVPSTTAEVALVEQFSASLDLHDYSRLSFELIIASSQQTGACNLSQPDVTPLATGARVTIRSSDGRSVDIQGAALAGADRSYLALPVTRILDLRAVADRVDLTHITAIEIRVPASSVARSVAFDDLRALR